MGATRPASGIKAKANTLNTKVKTLITCLPVNLCFYARGTRLLKNAPTRDASPPLVLESCVSVLCLRFVLALSGSI